MNRNPFQSESFVDRVNREDRAFLKRACFVSCVVAWAVVAGWIYFFNVFGAIKL